MKNPLMAWLPYRTKTIIQTVPHGMKFSLTSRPNLRNGGRTEGVLAFGASILRVFALLGFALFIGSGAIACYMPSTTVSLVLSITSWAIIAICGILHTLLTEFLVEQEVIFSKEDMSFRKTLSGLHLGQTDHYSLNKINTFRLTPSSFQFEYEMHDGTHTINVDHNDALKDGKANTLSQYLSAILKYHCHSVERIVFGVSSRSDEDPYLTIHNPDVSTLTVPFVHLRHILIATETYDFHQVERFLTYAVNEIGANYLQQCVDVHIYGDPERLHPNIRNTLTTLCKRVHAHKKDDMFVL